MASSLDEKSVGEVAECCPAEFLTYYDCLGGGDAQKCLTEQKTLSTCVTAKAPTFKQIIKNCTVQMNAYENCIMQNPDIRTQCFDRLVDMRKCVADVVESNPGR